MSLLNNLAAYSDETRNFISNPEPAAGEEIAISIRCLGGGADAVFLRTAGLGLTMQKYKSDEVFDYFQLRLCVNAATRYYFEIVVNGQRLFYNKRGLGGDVDNAYDFVLIPDFSVPDWAKNAVMYQIFVDRFYNGDPTNDVDNHEYMYLGNLAKRVADWNTPLANMDVCNFYGGDLAGVMQKMDYLAELGVEVIYFNPLFVSPSNHKYDAQDYDYIDPHYGRIVSDGGDTLSFDKLDNRHATKYIKRTTDLQNLEASNQLMIDLIKLAHSKGIKVVLDGVFNHCGAFHKWMDTEGFYSGGAFAEQNSPYHDYFVWHKEDWPKNRHYDAWWGHDNHPKLNFEDSPELYARMMQVAAKWVAPPFNADGWRLDVAADLGRTKEFNHKFWRDFRAAVKGANSDAIIIAEHYGDPADWLDGTQWDSVMNYDAFMEPVSWFFTGMQKHSESFSADMLGNAAALEGAMRYFNAKLPHPAISTAMNQLSNHDHSRFLTRTNGRSGRLHTAGAAAADSGVERAVMLAAVVMQFTWPGCPTVYYGDEAGLTGWTDPDNRRPYPWGREDAILLDFHKAVIQLHKNYSALRGGSLEFLTGFLSQNSGNGLLAYGRWDADCIMICAFNNNSSRADMRIEAWRAGCVRPNAVAKRVLQTQDGGYSTQVAESVVVDGILDIELPPYSSCVYHIATR